MIDRNAFADELLRVRPEGLTKQARRLPRGRIYERMAVTGGLAGLGGHTIESAKTGLSANPYDRPKDTATGALKKGALGGLLAALGLRTLGKMTKRRV